MINLIENNIKHKTLFDSVVKNSTVFIEGFYVFIAVILLAMFSNLQIPLQPVPITLQTFGVFLVAFFFGSRKGAITILAWILAALAGFGVFASYKSGIEVFFKAGGFAPSGGYIIGFLIAVFVVGRMIEKGYGRSYLSILYCLAIGNLIIYAIGLPWLWAAFPSEPLSKILEWGLYPFIIGDFLKILAAMVIFPSLWKAGEKIRA